MQLVMPKTYRHTGCQSILMRSKRKSPSQCDPRKAREPHKIDQRVRVPSHAACSGTSQVPTPVFRSHFTSPIVPPNTCNTGNLSAGTEQLINNFGI